MEPRALPVPKRRRIRGMKHIKVCTDTPEMGLKPMLAQKNICMLSRIDTESGIEYSYEMPCWIYDIIMLKGGASS